MMRCSRAWLCLPPLVLVLLDGALTLHGQPARYWTGEFVRRQELNPLADLLLAWHPGAFLLGWAGWCLLIATMICFSPVRLAFWGALVCSLGHGCGAASWVVAAGGGGWIVAIGLLLATDRVFWYAARRSGAFGPAERAVAADRGPPRRLPGSESNAGRGRCTGAFGRAGVIVVGVIPEPAFRLGQSVRVLLNDRNRTPHMGTICAVTWHHKDQRYNYYLTENGKKVAKRYFAEDLQAVDNSE
jgi:hypothetical protein